jgi:hypothetical protein
MLNSYYTLFVGIMTIDSSTMFFISTLFVPWNYWHLPEASIVLGMQNHIIRLVSRFVFFHQANTGAHAATIGMLCEQRSRLFSYTTHPSYSGIWVQSPIPTANTSSISNIGFHFVRLLQIPGHFHLNYNSGPVNHVNSPISAKSMMAFWFLINFFY